MSLSLKQNVKNKKISAQEAYSKLDALIEPKYKRFTPSLRWLKNIVNGRKIIQEPNNQQNKKLNFKNKKSLHLK